MPRKSKFWLFIFFYFLASYFSIETSPSSMKLLTVALTCVAWLPLFASFSQSIFCLCFCFCFHFSSQYFVAILSRSFSIFSGEEMSAKKLDLNFGEFTWIEVVWNRLMEHHCCSVRKWGCLWSVHWKLHRKADAGRNILKKVKETSKSWQFFVKSPVLVYLSIIADKNFSVFGLCETSSKAFR